MEDRLNGRVELGKAGKAFAIVKARCNRGLEWQQLVQIMWSDSDYILKEWPTSGLEMKKIAENNTGNEWKGFDFGCKFVSYQTCKWRCVEFKGKGQSGEMSAHKCYFMALDETTKR